MKDFGIASRIRGCYGKAPVVRPRFREPPPPRLCRWCFLGKTSGNLVFLEELKAGLEFFGWDLLLLRGSTSRIPAASPCGAIGAILDP